MSARSDNERPDPSKKILDMIFGAVQGQALARMAELGVADHLRQRPMPTGELASLTACDPTAMQRLVKLLKYLELLTEDDDGHYSCTDTGSLLMTDSPGSFRNYALLTNSKVVMEMLGHMRSSLETGHSAFSEIYNSSFYEALQTRPEDAAVFNAAMQEISAQDIPEILAACDLDSAKSIIDIGGGQGYLLAGILKRYPHLEAILFELADVADSAAEVLAHAIAEKRCRVIAGDFLDGVPGDSDTYILKRILSHCSDNDALKLLANIRQNFNSGDRLLIIDPDTESLYGASYNLLMLVVVGGKGVRSEDELNDLFARTGFRQERKISLKTELCIVEVVST